MKKIALFFFLLCLTSLCVNAQNSFAPVGAEWWYSGNNVSYTYGPLDMPVNETWTDHLLVTGDTTIQGVDCRKVTATRMKKTGHNPDSSFVDGHKTMYFYDNTDTVFYWHIPSGRFEPLYIFNAAEGDTICLKNPYFPMGAAGEDSTFCFTIDSIRTVLFDTTLLKTFYTRTLFDSTDFLYPQLGAKYLFGEYRKMG